MPRLSKRETLITIDPRFHSTLLLFCGADACVDNRIISQAEHARCATKLLTKRIHDYTTGVVDEADDLVKAASVGGKGLRVSKIEIIESRE